MFHLLNRFKKRHYFKSVINISATSKNLALLFLCLFTLHVIAMMALEEWSLEVALWFTVTAGTTVGFGDYSPATTWGRLATVFLIYVPAIPTIAFLTGRLVEKIVSRRERKLKGNWNWKMQDHIVFINYPNIGGDIFFKKIIQELKNSSSMADQQMVIVTDKKPEGLPQSLVDLNVKLVTGRPNSGASFERASVSQAQKVVILCEDFADSRSDSLVFDIASLILQSSAANKPNIVAEAVLETTKTRLTSLGVQSVLRPIRAYPELIARTIISPGSEQIIESLFDSNQEECLKFTCNYQGQWADLATKIILADLGTPIAVEFADGTIRANLRSKDIINIKSIFIIVPEGNDLLPQMHEDINARL